MKNSMIIEHGSENLEHFTCPCINCDSDNPDETIPTFYSYQHAKDSGWNHTNDTAFCPPNESSV